MNLNQCQEISDALVRIDIHATRADKRIKNAIGTITGNLMPYTAKQKATILLNEARIILSQIEDEKKIIYEILKKEREGQE